jgi:hypothetical protein
VLALVLTQALTQALALVLVLTQASVLTQAMTLVLVGLGGLLGLVS